VFEFLRRTVPSWPNVDTAGAREYAKQVDEATKWAGRARSKGWTLAPPPPPSPDFESAPLGLKFHENMKGYVSAVTAQPKDDAAYAAQETLGRPAGFIELDLYVKTDDLSVFFEDETHTLQVQGDVTLPGEEKLPVSGTLQLFVPRVKPYAIGADPVRRSAHERLLGGGRTYKTIRGDAPSEDERLLDYRLTFDGEPGCLRGYKRIKNQPALDAWRDTSTLFTWVERPDARDPMLAGVAHVELDSFLFNQLSSIEVTGTKDPARITWATATFGAFFFGSLQRIYAPAIDATLQSLLRRPSSGVRYKPSRM
jgi:cholesterol oxidase